MDLSKRQLLEILGATMLGLVSASSVSALLAGCERADKSGLNSKQLATEKNPLGFFSPHQKQTVSQLAEIIIPRTSTPGAIDAGIPGFIEAVVQDVFTPEDQAKFHDGLFSLDLLCTRLTENNFIDLPIEHQNKLATHLNFTLVKNKGSRQVLLEKSKLDSKHLESALNYFSVIKKLTIFGFFTSEIGATQVLHYNPVPGRFNGCVPLSEIGKTWATPK